MNGVWEIGNLHTSFLKMPSGNACRGGRVAGWAEAGSRTLKEIKFLA